MDAIEISGLKKKFENKEGSVWALKGIDLKIRKGEIFGLLGPNGAGKTTLIYILSTLLLPTSGQARILGYDVVRHDRNVRERVGLCMGGTFFYWDMNPKEILEYYGRLYGLKAHARKRNADILIRKLGIKAFENRSFGNLSTGMRQKVAVAKSLINEPEVLFLDEPTAGLDVEVALDVRNFIMDMLKEREMTVILTSHHLHEVEEMCKKVAIINKGNLVAHGDIRDIKDELRIPDVIHLYLDRYKNLGFLRKMKGVLNYNVTDGVFIAVDSGLERLDGIVKGLKKRGIKITDMEIKKASLEDVFLTIIGRKEEIRIRGVQSETG